MDQVKEDNRYTGLEIAVIGMAGRFPGARNLEEFWHNLKNGIESISFFTDGQLEEMKVDPALLSNPLYVKTNGGFLEGKEEFDASFFDYVPSDVEFMNPQTRMMHELAWEALENAGYNPGDYEGAIGLYAGASTSFFWEAAYHLGGKHETLGPFEAYLLIDKEYLCSRVAYKLNLKGPAVLVQSACSTSMVAIDTAIRGLLTGVCDMALAGGISIKAKPQMGYLYQDGMILSPDGHCRAFDAAAKGIADGEGAGLAVLKPLEDAIAEGDHIYAVIKGIAVNNDGNRKVGYTAPSVKGQAKVIRSAMQMAEVEAESITYVETHGTGTEMGDPIEIEALKKAFDHENPGKKHKCALGSVKTNIGHLDAAAGIAGFIKTVLALRYRLIPPSLNFERPNPNIDFQNSPFYVTTQSTKWQRETYPLRAGVSSFGIGGTNVHAVLEEWPPDHPVNPGRESQDQGRHDAGHEKYRLILLSAKTKTALDKMTRNLVNYFKNNHGDPADPVNSDPGFGNAAYTLQVGRNRFKHRRMTVCADQKEAIEVLSAADSRKCPTFSANEGNRPIVFMFPGVGSQYVNMGLELYRSEPVFKQEMDRCFEILKTLLDKDIKEILYPRLSTAISPAPAPGVETGDVLHHAQNAQPVIFVFEYALAKLLMAWGITPTAMIGYSFGEYAAACISGVFSLEDALELVAARGRLIAGIPGGAMLSVPIPAAELRPLLNDRLSIAIDNGSSCIAAGQADAIEALERQMKNRKYLCMRLKTSYAIHSKMMDPILMDFEEVIKRFTLNPAKIPFISNVTGKWITHRQAVDPKYWSDHLRYTVRFSDGLNELVKEPGSIFVETGAGNDLFALTMRWKQDNPGIKVLNIVRPADKKIADVYYMLTRIGQLWMYGADINWSAFNGQGKDKKQRIPLPTYPFEGQRYWPDSNLTSPTAAPRSPLIKKKDIADWFYIPKWETRPLHQSNHAGKENSPGRLLLFIDVNECPFISRLLEYLRKDHPDSFGVVIVRPGATFSRTGPSQYTINPQQSDDYGALITDLSRQGLLPDHILHFWGLTTGPFDFEEAQRLGFYSLIYLVKAIGKKDFSSEIQLNVITNNVYDVTGEEIVCPPKATVIGPLRVIPQEYPYILCRHIDIALPKTGTCREYELVEQLIRELTEKPSDHVIVYRNNRRWIQTFEAVKYEAPGKNLPLLREQGVYLITGGLGKMGFTLAEFLVKHLKARLILVGRSTLPPRTEWEQWLDTHPGPDPITLKIRKIRDLEEKGGEISVYGVDAADLGQMQQVIARSLERFGSIHGVIHAAGDTGESIVCPIDRLEKEQCRKQFHPKIYALETLHKALQGINLDFCLLTSSLSPILGGLGFAAYSSANAFMDAYVHYYDRTRRDSSRWISVNWGDWQFEIGKSSIPGGGSDAILNMNPAEGIETFQRILYHCRENQVIVSAGDLHARLDKWVKLESLRGAFSSANGESGSRHSRPDLLSPYIEPRNQTEKSLVDIWQHLFGFKSLGIQDDFFELGGDSLKAITAISRIHKRLDVSVSLVDFYANSNVEKLAAYIGGAKKERFIALEPAEKKEYYLLSAAQQRLYLVNQMDPSSLSYNIPTLTTLAGDVDVQKLIRAFKTLVRRHESLMTAFLIVGETPVQVIREDVDFEILCHDLNSTPSAEEQEKNVIKKFVRPFDLSKPPLLRIELIKRNPAQYLLMMDFHHIVTDVSSMTIFTREFFSLYKGDPLPLLKIQYKDYASWQNNLKKAGELLKQEEFWLKEFEREIPVLELPTDFARPEIKSDEGDFIVFEVSPGETRALKELALEENASIFMILLAIYNVFLAKLNGQEDILVGTSPGGRTHADLEPVIGFFINTLVLRLYPAQQKTFREFLREVRKKTLMTLDNQDYQFEDLCDKVVKNRDPRRNPLFDVMFTMQNEKSSSDSIPGLTSATSSCNTVTSKFDLNLNGYEIAGKLSLNFEYCTKLFRESTIRVFINYFKKIVTAVVANPDIRISHIIITSDKRREEILSQQYRELENE